MRSISVVLPLALPTTYSYSLPPALEERVLGRALLCSLGQSAIIQPLLALCMQKHQEEKSKKKN